MGIAIGFQTRALRVRTASPLPNHLQSIHGDRKHSAAELRQLPRAGSDAEGVDPVLAVQCNDVLALRRRRRGLGTGEGILLGRVVWLVVGRRSSGGRRR